MRVTNRKIFNFIYVIVGVPLLFLYLFSSGMLTTEKTILLALFLVFGCIDIFVNRIKIARELYIYITVFVVYFFISLVNGIMRGYPFSLSVDFSLIQYYMITPIAVFVIAAVFKTYPERKQFLKSILMYMTLLLTILDLVAVLAYRNGIDVFIFKFIKISSGQMDSKLALRVSNETSLMFLVPMYIVMWLSGRHENKKEQIIYMAISILGTIYSLISGRKILEIVIVLAFVFMLFYNIKYGEKKYTLNKIIKRGLLIVLFAVVAYVVFDYIVEALDVGNIVLRALETLKMGLSSEADGVNVRVSSMTSLYELWLDAPIFGNGLNAYSDTYIANGVCKWSYEVVYNALLAQAGVIGILILAIGIIYMIKRLYRLFIKKADAFYMAIIVGFVAFLICGATNPLVYFVWPWAITLIYGSNDQAK